MENNIERKTYKIILLGDNYIGTTCLIRRYIFNEYDPNKYSYSALFSKKNNIRKWKRSINPILGSL